jgi:two-component system NarL family sensor kinase
MARALTITGVAMLLASVALQALPGGELWGGALWTAGFPLALAWYPGARLRPFWPAIPVVVSVVLAIAYLATDGAIGEHPAWSLVVVPHVVVVVGLALRYHRRLDTEQREQVRWSVLGGVLTLGTMAILLAVAALGGGGTIANSGPVPIAIATIAVAFLPLTLLVGMLLPRVIPVDPVLRATVAAIVAGLPATVAYLGVVAIGVPAWTGALVVGVVVYPAVRIGTRIADRLVYGGRPAPADAALELSRRLNAQTDPSETSSTLITAVRDVLHLDSVEVVPASGELLGEKRGIPISYRDEILAVLVAGPRRGESALTRRDGQVLKALAAAAAPALHGAAAYLDLTDARARAVIAREEERKVLRRDLHDDLAPTLGGLSLTAAGIARLVRSTDPIAADAADDLVTDVQAAMRQTRELAYGLRPPVLDDHGLAAAIRDRTRPTGDGLVIDITAPRKRLMVPAAVELAALRIVQEAVLNVRKHAQASRCDVLLDLHDGVLDVQVTDDGRGIHESSSRGLGLGSIRERARELGGSARIVARPEGGTMVAVSLPVAAAS